MTNKNLQTVQRIDFDRLDMLVSERIAALKIYATNIDKIDGDKATHDAVCRDLILPSVALLLEFIESVTVSGIANEGQKS